MRGVSPMSGWARTAGLRLRDVLTYHEERREEQYRLLEETAVDPDEEEDLDVVLDRLRKARQSPEPRG